MLEISSLGSSSFSKDDKYEADRRSVYIGNVDYSVTAEELAKHFESCGTIYRVTILKDKFGNPKGFAYLEFKDPDAISLALKMTGSELNGRQIKVEQKRTNTPGFSMSRGRGRGRGRARGRGRGGYRGYHPY